MALAAAIALVVVAFLWARTAEYRVLYSNLSDRDGGEVIAALAQQNVPYRVAEGGSVILVPGDRVYELRLQLAAQGLPKGGAVGFELMDAQKFGMSQFAEQVNYQRALAGELSRTVQSIAAVQGARVHLAIPRPTVFVRDRQQSQRLGAGELVSRPRAGRRTGQRDPASGRQQRAGAGGARRHRGRPGRQSAVRSRGRSARYRRPGRLAAQVSARASKRATPQRIENILKPIVGADNVRAQVTAALDFNQVEQTSETFKPNPAPQEASVRSQQTVETVTVNPQGPSGVPGALSNQPPGAAQRAAAPRRRSAAASASGAPSLRPTRTARTSSTTKSTRPSATPRRKWAPSSACRRP